jgi:hypothetical protein
MSICAELQILRVAAAQVLSNHRKPPDLVRSYTHTIDPTQVYIILLNAWEETPTTKASILCLALLCFFILCFSKRRWIDDSFIPGHMIKILCFLSSKQILGVFDLLFTCSQMLWIKNKVTQLLIIKDFRLPKHYLLMGIMIIRQRS